PTKCNLGPMPPALAYTIEPTGDTSRVGWVGEVDLSADQIIQHSSPGRQPKNLGEAEDFLREQLAGGSTPAADVMAAANARGISETTLKRAKKKLGIIAERQTDAAGTVAGWRWRLPEGQNTRTQNSGSLARASNK